MNQQIDKNNGQDYNQEYQEQSITIVQPQETVISLKKQQKLEIQIKQQKPVEKQKINIQSLKKQLIQKADNINNIKKSIIQKKNNIKEIGQIVDKQLNKNLINHKNKPNANVSIHGIFLPSTNHQNIKIKNLSEQLHTLRIQIKKQKQQIKRYQYQMMDPVRVSNMQRAIEIDIKVKEKQQKIKQLKRQKDILLEQLNRKKQQYPTQFQQDISQQFKKIKEQSNHLIVKLREEKLKIYQIDKIDCVLMEKIQFLKEVTHKMQSKKNNKDEAVQQADKLYIQEKIKGFSCQIRQKMQQKFKTQNQRSNTVRNLLNQIKNIQKKNWELIQLLREIDSYLLKYYSAKLRVNSVKKRQKEKTQKSAIYHYSKFDEEVDKLENEVVLETIIIEKKKTVEIGIDISEDYSVILTDEFIGIRNKINKICIWTDQEYIYGANCEYINEKKHKILGYNLLSRIKPKDTRIIEMHINEKQYISNITIGVNQNNIVKYLKLQSSNADNFIQWGLINRCVSHQQKFLKKYQGIYLRGKLVQISSKLGPNLYCLGGLGFTFIYLGNK